MRRQTGGHAMSNQLSLTKAKKEFFAALPKKPYSSALTLANLFYFLDRVNETYREKLSDLIDELSEKISQNDFLRIWNSIASISSEDLKIKEKSTLESIKTLKHELLQDINWLSMLTDDRIISVGQDQEYAREATIGLIRNHLLKNKEKDVFEDFDYFEILEADLEQSALEINSIIQNCKTLPCDSLKKLGEKSPEIGLIVMTDISSHKAGLEVIRHFAEKHPALRDTICDDWKIRIESLGFDDDIVTAIRSNAKQLSTKYPKFKQLEDVKRINREGTLDENGQAHPFDVFYGFGAGGAALYYTPKIAVSGKAVATLASAFAQGAPSGCLAAIWGSVTASAAPLILPALTVAGIGYFGYQYFHNEDLSKPAKLKKAKA